MPPADDRHGRDTFAPADRAELMNRALAMRGGDATYLELGVKAGGTFRKIDAATKIGVDPKLLSRRHRLAVPGSWLRSKLGARSGAFLFSSTSDDFFARHRRLLRRVRPAVVLIDGLHTAEQSWRDVDNALRFLDHPGVIVLHDSNPRSEAAAAATAAEAAQHPRYSGDWNGDVWRTIVRLRCEREDVRVCVLDCDEGLGLVARGAPDSMLDLDAESRARLTFAAFDARREELLNLRPPSYARDFLRELVHASAADG
jgi:hypothetical protein